MSTATGPQQAHRSELSSEQLSRLIALPGDGHDVLSLYLGFDPALSPHLRDRRAQADSLLATAERRYAPEHGEASGQELEASKSIRRVRRLLEDGRELAPSSARGLAIFCSAADGLFELIALPVAVEPRVTLDRRPLLAPLVELLSAERWCVLLVSRRASRVLVGDRDHLLEVARTTDDVHRQHAQGGFSQARFQRGVEKEAEDHVREACRSLFELSQARPFDRLLIGGPVELRPVVERNLHTTVRERLVDCFEIDVERADVEEARRRTAPLIAADERAREREALHALRDGLAARDHAAAGLDEVLELLNERRVQTLILGSGTAVPGFSCPTCGRLSATAGRCPVDGAEAVRHDDVTSRAIERALAQRAGVLVVRHRLDELAQVAQIAALVRY